MRLLSDPNVWPLIQPGVLIGLKGEKNRVWQVVKIFEDGFEYFPLWGDYPTYSMMFRAASGDAFLLKSYGLL